VLVTITDGGYINVFLTIHKRQNRGAGIVGMAVRVWTPCSLITCNTRSMTFCSLTNKGKVTS